MQRLICSSMHGGAVLKNIWSKELGCTTRNLMGQVFRNWSLYEEVRGETRRNYIQRIVRLEGNHEHRTIGDMSGQYLHVKYTVEK